MSEEKKQSGLTEKSVAEMFEAAKKKSEEKQREEAAASAENAEKIKTLLSKKGKKSAKNGKRELAELAGDGTRELTISRHYGYVKARKRKPKSGRFIRIVLICVAAIIALTAVLALIGVKLISSGAEETPEAYMRNLVATTDADGWKQFLRTNLPLSFASYAKPSDLAYKVLSPEFNVGEVTYLGTSDSGDSTYMLFSDGKHFADVIFEKKGGLFSRESSVKSVVFDLSFFENVKFPHVEIYVPNGAVLTVNGETLPSTAPVASAGAYYPGVSPGEMPGSVTSTLYAFDNLYYVPEISATLDGKALSLNSDDASHTYWFEYPTDMTYGITVVVPVEVEAFVGGTKLDETWASLELIDGTLGSLDDGGTGTLPKLALWTVKGLFKDTTVSASYKGKELKLESNTDKRYSFEIPVECKYTVTVTYPEWAELTVNGKKIANSENTIKTTADMLAGGKTVFGSFNSHEFSATEGVLPEFKTTTVAGYLAEPIVEVVLSGATLSYAGKMKDGYDISYEFDIPETVSSSSVGSGAVVKEINSDALVAGNVFFETYLEYITCGGIKDDPTNRAALDEKHDALLALTVQGTTAYYSAMSSYTNVSTSTNYESGKHADVVSSSVYEYTGKCLCFTLETTISRKAPEKSGRPDNSAFVKMDVMTVEYNDRWVVWAYSADVLDSK